jgi:hypothetical protein
MKKIISLITVLFVLISSCKNESKTKEEIPISVISIIKGQIQHLDTSLYQFTKYKISEEKPDTSWINREEAIQLASDFLTLPDISKKDYHNDYTEERLIDAAQNILSITAMAKKEEAEIQKQIIIINLDELASGKVSSIYFDRIKQVRDTVIEQKLFWEIDKFFQIGTSTLVNNQQEKTDLLKVSWQ